MGNISAAPVLDASLALTQRLRADRDGAVKRNVCRNAVHHLLSFARLCVWSCAPGAQGHARALQIYVRATACIVARWHSSTHDGRTTASWSPDPGKSRGSPSV